MPDRPGQRSLPWIEEEMISVNGRLYLYSLWPGETAVHFPGGKVVPLAKLREEGATIIPPRKWRTVHFG